MSTPASASPERHIVVLVYPDIMAMDVCGPMEAFAMANALAGRGLYRLSVTAVTIDPITTSLGFPSSPTPRSPISTGRSTRFWSRADMATSLR